MPCSAAAPDPWQEQFWQQSSGPAPRKTSRHGRRPRCDTSLTPRWRCWFLCLLPCTAMWYPNPAAHTHTGKITPLPSGWLHFGKSQASLPLADLSAQGNDNNETIRWTLAGVLIMGTHCWDSSAIHRGSIPGNTFSSGWKDGEGIAFRHTASKLTSQQNKWEDLYQNFHHECFLKRSFLT